MSAPSGGITRAQARLQADAEKAAQRNASAACALDFLVYGDDDPELYAEGEGRGRHAEHCVHGAADACSRDYSPVPYMETRAWGDDDELPRVITAREKALPAGDGLYAGTGIGALYGMGMTGEQAAELAGWNITTRSSE